MGIATELVKASGLGGTRSRSVPLESTPWDEVKRLARELAFENGQPTQISVAMVGARGGPRPYWELRALGNWRDPAAVTIVSADNDDERS